MAEPPDLADLKDQLAVETLISDVSATLAATTDQAFASALETALEMTARFSGADRGQLLSVHAPPFEVRVLHAWCAASVESSGGAGPALNLAEHTPWAADLTVTKRQPLVMNAVDELPAEAQRDRTSFTARGVRSAVWVPIAIGSDLRYMLAIEATHGEVRWPRALVRRLPRLGGILGHTVERKRLADAIRETDARITLATSSADAGPWGLDLSTGRIWATPAAKELHGFAADAEITFDQFLSVVHPEDVDRVRERVSSTAVAGADFADEYRVVLPGGAIRWIAVRAHIRRVLESTGWRIKGPKGAAAALGLNYGTLYGRMKKLGIRARPQADDDPV